MKQMYYLLKIEFFQRSPCEFLGVKWPWIQGRVFIRLQRDLGINHRSRIESRGWVSLPFWSIFPSEKTWFFETTRRFGETISDVVNMESTQKQKTFSRDLSLWWLWSISFPKREILWGLPRKNFGGFLTPNFIVERCEKSVNHWAE